MAPFWRGLNDHSDSWTEHQLVAAARGFPIPAPDEIPSEESLHAASTTTEPQPISFRVPQHGGLDASSFQPVFSSPNTNSPSSAPPASSPLFRGRSKTLASFTSRNGSQTELVPQEIKLPHEPYVNGQPVEAYLYKDASECPICFLYYPPYLNSTRCCDQPICSECFVQIKRPDPHPPEHADPTAPSQPPETQKQLDEDMLVSEPAQCPFCVQTDFGVTYDPPPFRRGLTYANHGRTTSFVKAASAIASSTSLSSSSHGNTGPPLGRRRGQSLSATAPQVVTTDKVRPDWAKKLSDARAHAARRSAAATALHNAAYLMGGGGPAESRFGLGRRRRHLFIDNLASGSGSGTSPGVSGVSIPNMEMLLSALEGQSSAGRARQPSDLTGTRISSRGSRMDELEELMLMEAIRQSLAAEEERKRKEDKEATKQAKKDDKQKAKDQKKAEKVAKKTGVSSAGQTGVGPFYSANSFSNIPEDAKGKAKATDFGNSAPQLTFSKSSPLQEGASSWGADAQRHLELSRANLDSEVSNTMQSQPQPMPLARSRLRHMSDASSSASSFLESAPGSVRNGGSDSSMNPSPNHSGHHLPFGTQDGASSSVGTESMFNFASLAGLLGKENLGGGGSGSEHVENRKQSETQMAREVSKAGSSSSDMALGVNPMAQFQTSKSSVGHNHIATQERAQGTVEAGKYAYHKQQADVGVE